jgi:CBS domain-containing protein
VDIPSFLRACPPFDELEEDVLARVVRATSIEFFPAAQPILAQGGEPARFLYVVRTGSVEVLDGDQVVDLHQEGEVFGFVSLLTGEPPALGARAAEETICYLIEASTAESILATRTGASFLSRSVRRRELNLLEHAEPRADPWALPAGGLVTRSAVVVDASDSVRAVAERMAGERVSSALVRDGDRWGIVTDRDLRSRVLAQGRRPEAPVAEVATVPVLWRSDTSTVGEVLATMLERGIHHVPLADATGAVVGVLTDTDLMALERRSAFQLRYRIERAKDPEGAAELGRGVSAMVADLVEAGVEALEVAHVTSVTADVLTRRLLALGVERLGPPPAAWAWLALGAEARWELSLCSDQDHALVWAQDGDGPEADAYFARLAGVVTDGLEAAGIVRCPDGVIAADAAWRGPVDRWRARISAWSADPEGAMGPPALVLDHRVVAGTFDVDRTVDREIQAAARRRVWLRALARRAVLARAPRGFLREAVVDARGSHLPALDARAAGIGAITDLARVHAVRAGVRERPTVRRLRGAVAAGRLSEEAGSGLEEAFRLLWRIRSERHAACVRAGIAPDDLIDPRTLGPLVRQALKEAFRLIDRAQALLALELDLRR